MLADGFEMFRERSLARKLRRRGRDSCSLGFDLQKQLTVILEDLLSRGT
jgi:hypothetical protein